MEIDLPGSNWQSLLKKEIKSKSKQAKKNFENFLGRNGLTLLAYNGIKIEELGRIWPEKFGEFEGDMDLEERLRIEGLYEDQNKKLIKQVKH